jgi:hypothetical protein
MITPGAMPPVEKSSRRWWLLGILVAIGGAAAMVAAIRWTRSADDPSSKAERQPETRSAPLPFADPDDRFRRMLIGTWADDYQGKRTMTLDKDGTGTMVVELSGWRAALSAPRLRFDMVWSVKGGRLEKRTVGGEPEGQVQMILKMMGERVDEPIVGLTTDRLLLLDQDGKTQYDWRRVEE